MRPQAAVHDGNARKVSRDIDEDVREQVRALANMACGLPGDPRWHSIDRIGREGMMFTEFRHRARR